MLEGILKTLPVDISKFKQSPEFERLLRSILSNTRNELNNPDSSVGLALNALLYQLSNADSQVMNEANFTIVERQLLSMSIGQAYDKLKGD